MECPQWLTLVMVLNEYLLITYVKFIFNVIIILAAKNKQGRHSWDKSIVGIISALQAISAG